MNEKVKVLIAHFRMKPRLEHGEFTFLKIHCALNNVEESNYDCKHMRGNSRTT